MLGDFNITLGLLIENKWFVHHHPFTQTTETLGLWGIIL